MQTEQQLPTRNQATAPPLADMPDETIAQQDDQAQAERARLEKTAAECDDVAAKAALAFEQEPTPAAFAARAVAAQLAQNAHGKIDAHNAEHAPLATEAHRRKRLRRLADLREMDAWPAAVAATSKRLGELYADFIAGAQSEAEALGRLLEANNIAVQERNGLEATLGDGEQRRAVHFPDVSRMVHEQLGKRFGKIGDHGQVAGHPGVRFAFGTADRANFVECAVRFLPTLSPRVM